MSESVQPVDAATVRAEVVADLTAKIEQTRAGYATLAADCWEGHDVMTAVRFRGLAEGLKVALGYLDEAVNGARVVGALPPALGPLMAVPSQFDTADLADPPPGAGHVEVARTDSGGGDRG